VALDLDGPRSDLDFHNLQNKIKEAIDDTPDIRTARSRGTGGSVLASTKGRKDYIYRRIDSSIGVVERNRDNR
jgi:hypothetical protein